jgi:2-methylcitrate dehydratase PrpD
VATSASTLVGDQVVDFVHGVTWADTPAQVRRHLALLLIDFAAVSVAGRVAPASAIAADHAAETQGGSGARSLLDGRELSVPGAAWANGVLANVLDFDDGHRITKGHPGAMVIPGTLAVAQAVDATMLEFLEALLVGYEVAIHAGVLIHEREAQYHASASWGSLGVAAAAGRLLGLDATQLWHALGIAEYHAPIALMPRAVGDPAMTKDTCGWGAMNGTNSALLAHRGFTGLTGEFTLTERDLDLGGQWGVLDMYIKPYPCCRWSQGAIDAARSVGATVEDLADIDRITVRTFAAADLLSRRRPTNTEEMQYSLVWPVATALARGDFGVPEVLAGFDDPAVHRLAGLIDIVVDDELTALFPARRVTSVDLRLADGSTVSSGRVEAGGEPGTPDWEDVILRKAALHLSPNGARCTADPTPPEHRLGGADERRLMELITYGLHPADDSRGAI